MPERARVTSLEAIETFRARLIVYREKAGRILDDVGDGVVRTRLWLQTNRIAHWKGEIRQRELELKQKQEELFSAQLSDLPEASYVRQAAVRKAQEAVRVAEERLQTVKQWNRQYDQRVEPLAHQVEKFRHDLSHDLGKALAWLNEVSKTLGEYAELSPTAHPAASAPKENQAASPAPSEDKTRS